LGERFYKQQLAAIGICPGSNTKKSRRKTVAWTDEKKAQAVDMYKDAKPTEETSIEIVKQIAEEMDETVNGVRIILVKAGVYLKKGGSGDKGKSDKPARVSKEDSQDALKAAIEDAGQEVDEDIISKLTGKAAVYFTGVISALNK
jgi:hypothetical protein